MSWVAIGELPNITIPDANDGWDIAQALVYAVVLVGGAIILILVRQVLNQVKNSHGTNMRDDIDELRADIKAVHTEVRAERSERREDVQELRDDVRRQLGAIQRSITPDAPG